MAFNKSKALESALKYLNQGKVAQAIGEYQQILRHDPKDQATLMTVGDLFARQSDMPQAIEYFERLAQVYLSDGFNSKAIAIYKKIAKLAPAELAPLERLADLYVQQGVLSEARPLFLQIAEVHLKANRAPKAVEVLNRLLEVEPENPRVQMRLAELYNVMGQKKEAAQTYLNYAQRLFDHGETEEAEKLIERALSVEAGSPATILLKGRILAASEKNDEAVALLQTHPDADTGGEVTDLLLELELKAGHADAAAARAGKQLARGSEHSKPLQAVVETLIAGGQADKALPLLKQLRDPMIEATEQDKFVKLLTGAIEKLPGNTEALEMLADFSRLTSDPFHLNSALSQLVDSYAAAGEQARAEHLMKELIDRNKGDERLIDRYNQLRQTGKGEHPAPVAAPDKPQPASVPEEPVAEIEMPVREEAPIEVGAAKASLMETAPEAPAQAPEEEYDEETRRYIAQALTDVDLFSSYGLTQKATTLLENVLVKAPRHTPTLERLLDLYLGAGNDRGTAEIAAQLEQIHRERQDTVNTERFAELRQRFQKLAGVTDEDLGVVAGAVATAKPAAAPPPAPVAKASQAAASVELDPVVAPEPAAASVQAPVEFEIPLTTSEPEPAAVSAEPLDPVVEPEPVAASGPLEEVDLSDEWEAMVQEVSEPGVAPAAPVQASAPKPAPPQPVEEERIELEVTPANLANAAPAPLEAEFEVVAAAPEAAEPEPVEITEPAPSAEPSVDPSFEIIEEAAASVPAPEPEAEATPAGNLEFELELTPEPAATGKNGAATTEDFLSELASEVEDMETPAVAAPKAAAPAVSTPRPAAPPAPVPVAPAIAASAAPPPAAFEPAPEPTAESLNQLAEVFQDFRNELGEIDDGDEDLETHYNLGIAYREMGLLDEAIGEFQKVAKAVQKGKPFQYAMNCATLLALSFMDKNEPKIASLWYRRALEMPGLEQEAVMALRYDLALALDLAGEADAALDSFRQVYAMNIDYRDVADRIATLQKH